MNIKCFDLLLGLISHLLIFYMIETMQESLQKLKEYVDEMIKIFEFTS